jgi:hypothetical protein
MCGIQTGSSFFLRIFRRAQSRSRMSRHLRIFRLGLGRRRDRRTRDRIGRSRWIKSLTRRIMKRMS